MRIDPVCRRFLQRIDRADPDLAGDPHAASCPSCAEALRISAGMRAALQRPPAPAAPRSFAVRTARIASMERSERPRAHPFVRVATSPAFITTAVLTAVAAGARGLPAVLGGISWGNMLPVIKPDTAVPLLACMAIAALAGIRLVRRAV